MKVAPDRFRVGARDKKRALDYYRRISSDYDAFSGFGFYRYFRERERNSVMRLLDLKPGGRFLDVGCGSGFYSLAAKRAGLCVTSADIVPEYTDRLKHRVDEVIHSDVESLELPSCFDRVVCAGVLDFVLDPERAFRRLGAVLKSGGKLVLLIPRSGIGGEIYRLEKRLFGINVNLFCQEWLDSIANSQGLVLEKRENPLPNSMALAYRKYSPALGPSFLSA